MNPVFSNESARAAALFRLERIRREGGNVPPGVRKAWGIYQLTGRVPGILPKLKRLPAAVRVTDPTAPGGIRTLHPTPGQGAILATPEGPVQITPEKLLHAYIEERARLPQYAAAIERSAGELARARKAAERIRKRIGSGRSVPPRWRQRFRDLDRELREREETHGELSETLGEAVRIQRDREDRAERAGTGFVFAWPLVWLVASLSLGGWGVTRELSETERLRLEVEALEKGLAPSPKAPLLQVGGGSGIGIGTLIPIGIAAWLLWPMLRRRRGGARA